MNEWKKCAHDWKEIASQFGGTGVGIDMLCRRCGARRHVTVYEDGDILNDILMPPAEGGKENG